MILKNGCPVLICAALLAWTAPSAADGYRADQFLGLDLSKAVLSPKPLGPETHFAPVPVEAASDHDSDAAQARAEPKPAPHVVVPKTRIKTRMKTRISTRVVRAHVAKPHRPVRARLARRHRNPLDAEAFDTRIQVWPCKSGGICNWQWQAN
jgi:hypothetical protein